MVQVYSFRPDVMASRFNTIPTAPGHALSGEAYVQGLGLHRNMPLREAFPHKPSLAVL
jgi:hypothetical protein